MQDHPVLSQLALGCSPVIDAQRSVIGTRITVFPDRPEAPLDAAALLVALGEVWPPVEAAGGAAIPPGTVVLNLVGESAVRCMLAARPSAPFAVEVPAFMLADPEVAAEAQAHQQAGGALWIKGRLNPELSPALLACFGVLVLEVGDAIPPARPRLKTVTAGVRTGAEVEAALKQGSIAALGWPLEDPVPPPPGGPRSPRTCRWCWS
jgi:c-di-GMP phosphodiesterase